MLNSLRKKLALICILTTGILLSFTAVGLLFLTEQQLDKQSEITFQNNLNSLIYKLQTSHTIDGLWLSQLEAGNRLIVHIEDDGSPILFRGSWNPKTDRNQLIRQAQQKALTKYHFNTKAKPSSVIHASRVTFPMKGAHGDRYQGAVASLSSGGGSWQSVTLLRDLSGEQKQKLTMRLSFLGLIIGSLIILFLLSWWLSGRTIKPIEANRRRQAEFVAAASHELRSPLAVISASLSAADNGSQTKFLQIANRECGRMARLIDDLLLLASADAGTWSVHTEKIEPDTLMTQLYESFQPIAAKKGQSILLNLPEDALPPIYGDSQRLFQALAILVDNALSYTPAGGKILLDVRMQRRPTSLMSASRSLELLFSVADDGPGVPSQQKERIFDRFYRADPSRSKKEHYGLGLSVAREITERHGGVIAVSDRPEGGAVFTIRLPLSQKREE